MAANSTGDTDDEGVSSGKRQTERSLGWFICSRFQRPIFLLHLLERVPTGNGGCCKTGGVEGQKGTAALVKNKYKFTIDAISTSRILCFGLHLGPHGGLTHLGNQNLRHIK